MPTPPETRIILFGTGDFALPTFLHLHERGDQLVALVTQPDRPQGRKQELIPSRIKVAAVERGVPVYQPDDVNTPEAIAAIAAMQPDVFVTAAYGQILSADLLAVPRLGGINLHGSILPAYRGAAPVARAIERGETETGVTVIVMNPRVDAGGMIHVGRTPIDPDETAGALEARLAQIGAPLLAQTLDELVAGTAAILPQDRRKVTRAPKLRKEDGRIDWARAARKIHDLVRAMQPWPAADTFLHRASVAGQPPMRLIVHATRLAPEADLPPDAEPGLILDAQGDRLLVATGSGALQVLTVQVVGKKPMPAADFLRGHPLVPGIDRFGPG